MSSSFHKYLPQDANKTKPRKCFFSNCNNMEEDNQNPDALNVFGGSQNKFKSVYCCPKHSTSSTAVHKTPSLISQPLNQAPNQSTQVQSVEKKTCRITEEPNKMKPLKCLIPNCNNVEEDNPNPDPLAVTSNIFGPNRNQFRSIYCCPKHFTTATPETPPISQPVNQASNQPPKSVEKETCRITADTKMNEICRLCLKSIDITTDKSFVPIFGPKTVTLNRYKAVVEPSQLITNFTWISETELKHSLFPQQICKNCFRNLCAMDKFRKMCEKANETLSKVILKNEEHNDEFYELIEIEMVSDNEDDVNVDGNNDVDGIILESEPVKDPSEQIISYLTPQRCPICLETVDSCEDLKYHRKARHTGLNTFVYKCYVDNCKKVFKTIGRLQEHHEKFHPVGLSFRCEICKKVVFSKKAFKHHIARHGERKHVCTTCGKSFVGRGQLVNHQLVHNGQRNFKCDICLKAFKKPYAMRVHKRIHTNEKPFICHLCGEAFAYKCLMKTHLEKYHPNEPSEKVV